MAKFSFTIVYDVKAVGNFEVSAKDLEEAEAKVEQLIDEGKFGFLHWERLDAEGKCAKMKIEEEVNDVSSWTLS